ncbi:MAG: hypothetical protein M4579_007202 [Chaenotheca gracillima]|nr:MAG: hypothetical protein M4579_007202 [Chaenotheca gracillima]
MHILQCFLFSITLWSAHTTAFYVWKSEEARDLPGSGGGDVEKREPFYIAGTATTDPGDGELNAPTLQIKRRVPQGSSPHARVERELKHILAKYRPHRLLVEHTSPNPAPAPSKVKRDNKYHVETATPPSQSSSVAVNQDGTDFSYFATVDFGSSNKAMYMLIDTGAANTWVMSGDCTSKACSAHNTFGEADSKTLTKDNTPWHVSYGTGTVKGTIYNDSMSLAGFTVPMSFGAASDTSDDFLDYPMDGILGLGRAGSNELEIPAFMDVLADQKKLTANLFGVNLQRHSDGETDGELNFGSYDKSKFKGDISWIPSSSKVGLWEIPVDDAGVDGNPLGFKGKSAIIDTGTSFILLPGPDAQKLHAKIPNAALKGNTYQLPCSSMVDLQFTFGGVDYTVPAKDYVGSKTGSGDTCLSNIIPQAYSGANDWLLGDTFLKNVYTVFDFDQDRIGKTPFTPL